MELERIRKEIAGLCESGASDQPGLGDLAPVLIYRREIAEASEWPFDMSVMGRLALYLIIPPLTWIGAALIEILIDSAI